MSRHAWAEWVDPDVRNFLWKCKEGLKVAWKYDRQNPKRYPINTALALAEIQTQLTKPERVRTVRLFHPKPPRTLGELISERTVKSIWEDNHNESFEEALARAAAVDHLDLDKCWKTFQGIVRAIETAYQVDYWGLEFLKTPKVNILHTGLDEIAKAAGLEDQIEVGFAEFLNDLCPCGLKNHREAVRKVASRSNRLRRPKT